MKHLFFISAMLLLTASPSKASDNSYILTSQERIATANFEEVRVRNAFNIILIPSNRNEVVLPENLRLPRGLEAKDIISVERGTLTIGIPESFRRRNTRIFGDTRQPDIRVYYTSLNALRLSGASSATSEGSISASAFQIGLSGASRANLDVVANSIVSGLSGSSNLTLIGIANEHTINASGSSRVNAENVLETTNSTVSLSGSSGARIVAENVRVGLSGSSNLTLNARDVRCSTSGSSRIRLNADAQRHISTSGSSSVRNL